MLRTHHSHNDPLQLRTLHVCVCALPPQFYRLRAWLHSLCFFLSMLLLPFTQNCWWRAQWCVCISEMCSKAFTTYSAGMMYCMLPRFGPFKACGEKEGMHQGFEYSNGFEFFIRTLIWHFSLTSYHWKHSKKKTIRFPTLPWCHWN